MRLKIFVAFALMALASCSGDDAPATQPDNPGTQDPVQKDLARITKYKAGEALPIEQWTFSGNRPIQYKTAMVTGGPLTHVEHYTFQNGHLSYTDIYENGTRVRYILYDYDEQGRLLKTDDMQVDGEFHSSVYDYIYDGNSITWKRNNFILGFYKLNDEGQIYRDGQKDETIYELDYDGNNLTSWTYVHPWGTQDVVTYTYNDIPVKGHYLRYNRNLYASQANMVLIRGIFATESDSDNYLVSIDATSNILTYQYQFDSDGYPVQKSAYRNNVLQFTEKIEYYE